MNTTETNKTVAMKWMSAFNAHDLHALLDLYHHNARHFSPRLKLRQPETNGLIEGKEKMQEWWREAFDRMPALKYRLNGLTADERQVFMEYTRLVPGEEDQDVAEVLEVKDGLIVFSRVYLG